MVSPSDRLRLAARRIGWLAAAVLATGSICPAPASPVSPPRLVLVIAVPGLRADFLDRLEPFLGETGIRRFLEHGARFTRARTGLAFPEDAPALATLATGVWPATHGVIADVWRSRTDLREIGPLASDPGAPALTAQVEEVSDGQALTFVVAWSERAARLVAGSAADAALWFSPTEAAFVARAAGTGGAAAPEWLRHYIAGAGVSRFLGKSWEPLRPGLAGGDAGGDRRHPGAGEFGATFPHRLPDDVGGLVARLGDTPLADRMTFEVAAAALLTHPFGKDESCDLLQVIPESMGSVGRRFGPDSPEALDVLLRLDQQVAALLGVLDGKVGVGHWTAILVGLNGMPPLPAESARRGLAIRTFRFPLAGKAKSPVAPANHESGSSVAWAGANVYLAPDLAERTERIVALRTLLLREPSVYGVFTRAHFDEHRLPEGPPGDALRHSYDPERSGDLLVVLGENASWAGRRGPVSPWPHSTDIVCLLLGAEVRRGVFHRPVTLSAIAPTAARLLALPPRSAAERPLQEALRLTWPSPETR